MLQETGGDEGEHGIAGGQKDFGLRLERLRFQAVLQRGPALGLCNGDVGFAGGIQAIGKPAQRLRLFDAPCT